MKINLAVSELPMVRGLPEGGVQPYHTGIMELNPFIPDMDMQQAQARRRHRRPTPHTSSSASRRCTTRRSRRRAST